MTESTSTRPCPVRLTIHSDSLSTCSSAPLSPTSSSSSPFSPSPCPSSSLSPMSTSPPMSPIPRTPIPADSPLFSKPPIDTKRRRYKSFSRDIRKRRSSRARSNEKSDTSPASTLKTGDSVSFLIKKHSFGKEGWKIMPEDESFNIELNAPILAQAVQAVRQMIYAGHDVPHKMTLVIQ